jgi:hypothetical protein
MRMSDLIPTEILTDLGHYAAKRVPIGDDTMYRDMSMAVLLDKRGTPLT